MPSSQSLHTKKKMPHMQDQFHRMRGCEFGPFKGAVALLVVAVFFFPVGVCFFSRASAAAARSARIFSLSSFVRFGFTSGAGTLSSFRFMDGAVGGEDLCLLASSTEPSLCP